ncbi:MAG TPA: hypothetical protein VKT49_05330 [Bryobacteraceae bacterium]|nr:hypothetical protein [Bryobacteraceae bacterium]
MLHSLNLMNGASIHATDGMIGSVSNFFFDDLSWTVRYVVVDTGNWLARRNVLLAIPAIEQPDWEKRVVSVRLTKEQVRHCPDVDTEKPVSRQQEIAMSRYFGSPTYWSVRIPVGRYTTEMEYPIADGEDNPHLRSAWDLAGYEVCAVDGALGRLEDYVMDEASWHLGYLIVETGNWLNSQNLLVSTRWVESISWANRRIDLAGPRAKI